MALRRGRDLGNGRRTAIEQVLCATVRRRSANLVRWWFVLVARLASLEAGHLHSRRFACEACGLHRRLRWPVRGVVGGCIAGEGEGVVDADANRVGALRCAAPSKVLRRRERLPREDETPGRVPTPLADAHPPSDVGSVEGVAAPSQLPLYWYIPMYIPAL